MLVVNLSREKIILSGMWFTEELPYMDIERKLPVLLAGVIDAHAIEKLRVINGPGSFTSLRLWCVMINIIQAICEKSLDIYTSTKLDIYRYAVEQWVLPSTWLVFIGQKKNMRMITRGVQSIDEASERTGWWDTMISNKQNLDMLEWKAYFIDACEHMLLEDLERDKMVHRTFDGESILLTYQDNTLSLSPGALGCMPKKEVFPQYMIEPQIG